MECRACPLNQVRNRNPHMEPTGSDHPLVYMLGEAPGEQEDREAKQFVGKAGKTLRMRIPKQWLPKLRWNNVVRTRPPENRTPSVVEIESCRPSIERDIAKTKPVAIFGFGNVPLQWAIGRSGIGNWNGRRIPIQVAGHRCWFYPMYHPSFVNRTRRFDPRDATQYGSDIEFVFAKDLEHAFEQVAAGLPEPIVDFEADVLEGVRVVTGNGKDDLATVLEYIASCYDEKVVGFDLETEGLRPYAKKAKILTVALARKEDALGFPLYHKEAGWTAEEVTQIEDALIDFLLRAEVTKAVHHAAFEMEWIGYWYSKKALRAQPWSCTQSQAYVLDERPGKDKKCHSLAFVTLNQFGIDVKKLAGVKRKSLENEPVDFVCRYNAVDAKYHRKAHFRQMALLKQEGLLEVYRQHMRRVPTMALTQLKGVPIDQSVVRRFYKQEMRKRNAAETKLFAMDCVKQFKRQKGERFRPGANEDVLIVLRKILGFFQVESSEEDELLKIKHEFASTMLEWRKPNKVLSTYVLPVMAECTLEFDGYTYKVERSEHLWPDGKLHPVISTTKTRTWRTSSEEPNQQNWPKRKQREVRSMVKPPGELMVVSFDYAQIQARNVAMESKDKKLVKYMWDRHDIHADWTNRAVELYPRWIAEGVKKLSDKKVFKSYRDKAKNEFVFPSFFGAQPPSLSKYLGIPVEITTRMREEFFEQFPEIFGWHKRITKEYYERGYVTGLTGFRRRAPISPNELINAPIQADEALIVCDAMARLSELEQPQYQATMEIHDDLTFIWPKRKIEEYAEVVIDHLLAVPFDWAHIVPIGIEMSVGPDWEKTQEVGDFWSDKWTGRLSTENLDKIEARRKAAAPVPAPESDDPFKGSWDDGTGWANSRSYEKSGRWREKRLQS